MYMIHYTKANAKYISQILQELESISIMKIILFGSTALDTNNIESDIDLLIVLDDNFCPQTYEERMEYRLKIRRKLRAVNRHVAIDLLIYTIPEYELIKKNMNSFFKEIHATGRIIYEKAS